LNGKTTIQKQIILAVLIILKIMNTRKRGIKMDTMTVIYILLFVWLGYHIWIEVEKWKEKLNK
jgi:hypothetical protein